MIIAYIFILITLFILSLTSVEGYLIGNVILAAALPTFERLGVDTSWSFAQIKLVFLAAGFLRIMVVHRSNITPTLRRTADLGKLFLIYFSASLFMSALRGRLNYWFEEEFKYLGFAHMLLFFIFPLSAITSARVVHVLKWLSLYIFVPCSLFGILQYIYGESLFSWLGMKTVTLNTILDENVYMYAFSGEGSEKIRVFSFLTQSADLACIMFHGIIWSLVLWSNDIRTRAIAIVLFVVFFIGLAATQYVTIMLLTLAGIIYYFLAISAKREKGVLINLTFLISAGLFGILLFPDVVSRITSSINLQNLYDSPSLGARLIMISRFPEAIMGVFFEGGGFDYFSTVGITSDQRILFLALMFGVPMALLTFYFFLFVFRKARIAAASYSINSDKWKLLMVLQITFLSIIIGDISNGQIVTSGPSNVIVWSLCGLLFISQNPSSHQTKISSHVKD
jgi:hypothetical protein